MSKQLEKTLPISEFPQPGGAPDRVELALGLTLQIRDYEYARIDVRYGSDVRPGETRDDTLVRLQEFVEPAIQAQYQDVLAMTHEVAKGKDKKQSKQSL